MVQDNYIFYRPIWTCGRYNEKAQAAIYYNMIAGMSYFFESYSAMVVGEILSVPKNGSFSIEQIATKLNIAMESLTPFFQQLEQMGIVSSVLPTKEDIADYRRRVSEYNCHQQQTVERTTQEKLPYDISNAERLYSEKVGGITSVMLELTYRCSEKCIHCYNEGATRNDDEISKKVTDNADVPTIFEYVLGVIWYKVSGYKGRILDYMKLSLDANLLPITHAAGGEADIVYEYNATNDYPAHTLLLEATLADRTNQRRMEMEPVSRHLGNHLLRTKNKSSYCLFATNYLDKNVISDFRGRKHMVFYDSRDESQYVEGMKIIPLQTSDLRSILIAQKTYSDLYPKYEEAYQNNTPMLPLYWYKKCVQEKTKVETLLEAPEMAEYANRLMKEFQGISVLTLQRELTSKYQETYFLMNSGDWYHAVRDYVERQTLRHDIEDEEPLTWHIAAEQTELRQST